MNEAPEKHEPGGAEDVPPPPGRLREWSQELLSWWDHFDWLFARSRMRQPQLLLSDSKTYLGRWHGATRTLELSWRHLLRDSWSEVLETLRHEMAHQWVQEVDRVLDEPPHGPAFRRACEVLRADPRAHACERSRPWTLEPQPAGADPDDRLRQRVTKLLSLANSPNEHEAEVAMKKARELLVRHRLADLDSAHPEDPCRFALRELGTLKRRRAHWEYQLGDLLQNSFFVSVIWVDRYRVSDSVRGRVLEICGTRFHLDMAEYVHGYLTQLLPDLWNRYRLTQSKVQRGEKQRYFAGVLAGFAEQLDRQDGELAQREGLIVAGDPALDEFHGWMHPRIRRSAGAGVRMTAGYVQGVADGREVKLRQPLRARSRGHSGRALPPPRIGS